MYISENLVDTEIISFSNSLLIAGMGYRKALEYLIKDYIIYINPDKESEVKSMLLGKCINDLVENPKINS